MAERKEEHKEDVFTDQLIAYFSGLNINQNATLDESVVKILKDELEKLKCMDIRSFLDESLSSIDLSLSKMVTVKKKLDVYTLSVEFAGDLMVSDDKFMDDLIKNIYEVKEGEKEVEGEVKKLYLTNEPALCVDMLTDIRKLIHDCLNLHTELYLMAQDISELMENIQLMNINISVFEGSDELTDTATLAGMIIGGILGAIVAGECFAALFWCFGSIAVALLGAGSAFAVILGLGFLASPAWEDGTCRREYLEEIYKFRIKLEKSKLQVHMKTLYTKLSDIKSNTQKTLTNNKEVNPLSLNLIMKSYKDYRRALAEALEDSDGLTEEQLSRVLSSQYSYPLRNKFNLSKSQARELIEIIHGIVTRKTQ